MSDADLAPTPDDDERPTLRDDVRGALAPLLRPGDAFVVRCADEDVTVAEVPAEVPSVASPLKRTHPRLYGALVAANQRVTDASGCGLLACFGAATLGVCFAIHARAFHGWAGDVGAHQLLDELRTWWVYAILTLAAIAAYSYVERLLERLVYAGERERVRRAVERERLEVLEVLALIEGDEALETVGKYLKKDRELDA